MQKGGFIVEDTTTAILVSSFHLSSFCNHKKWNLPLVQIPHNFTLPNRFFKIEPTTKCFMILRKHQPQYGRDVVTYIVINDVRQRYPEDKHLLRRRCEPFLPSPLDFMPESNVLSCLKILCKFCAQEFCFKV